MTSIPEPTPQSKPPSDDPAEMARAFFAARGFGPMTDDEANGCDLACGIRIERERAAAAIPAADLDAIEARARAATPGPWLVRESDATVMHHEPRSGYLTIAPVKSWDRIPENAAHIAGMDPATTLALVKRVRDAEAEAARQTKIAVAERRHKDAIRIWNTFPAEAQNTPERMAAKTELRAAHEALFALGVTP
jgi:hypothetical protein